MPKAEKTRKTVKGSKKAKDPNRPKRTLSAWMFFYTEQAAIMREANPRITVPDATKRLAERWKTLSDAERHPYTVKSAEDSKRYQAAKAAYISPLAEKPVQPMPNGYRFFFQEQRVIIKNETPDLEFGRAAQLVGARWHALDDTQRAHYHTMAAADRARHQDEMDSPVADFDK